MLKEMAANVWAALVKRHRLVLYDHESLSQTMQLTFKPIGAVAMVFVAFFLVAMMASLLVFKVPAIHRNIPGYQSHLSEEYMTLQRKNNELDRKVAEMDSMLNVFTIALGARARATPNHKLWQGAMHEPASLSSADSEREKLAQPYPGPTVAEVPVHDPVVDSSALHQILPRKRNGAMVLNLVSPIDGYVTKNFEPKNKPHFGIDLGADENALVRSVADGVIVFSEYSNTTGHVIGVWHSKYNLLSFYKHNSRLLKTVGSHVFAGEAIAVIGNTGINSSGTHLHFELWYDGSPVNPADYIDFI
ncbi:MAG: hypothetical protein RLZZ165_883 [Bacteroidota bacterium]|jgi:murein DD-endopeptidase MepM/ murein hydrolase activator NlpD